MASEDRFGYEWDKYNKVVPVYEKQFKNWIGLLGQEDFKNKEVLDAGCGMGRNSYWPLKWGAKYVTCFDLDDRSLNSAQKVLKEFKNKEIIKKSIYNIKWENRFDIAFSIGVVHHLKEPERALENLARSLKAGGKLLIWVYGYEGNEWIVRLINPIRKYITSKLPVPLVHFLSYIPSIPLWVFVKVFRGPSEYLKLLSRFSFWHIHSIVFDQLIPEVANYWTKKEALALLTNIKEIESVSITQINNNSWSVLGIKK